MSLKNIARSTWTAVWTLIALPWRAVKMNMDAMRRAKETHRSNIVMIRDMARAARQKRERGQAESVREQSFAQMFEGREPAAPTIEQLERHFLLQKRLAIWTCAGFALLSIYAITNGNLLGIATLLSSLPLLFMAALSAQLRLWQLRTRRLSRAEKGGLMDFIREIHGWYWEVLDPEYGKKHGEEK